MHFVFLVAENVIAEQENDEIKSVIATLYRVD